MKSTGKTLAGFVVVLAAFAAIDSAAAQRATLKAPTPADWAAMAKLPDLTGVWERVGGGGGARGAVGPSLTSEYAARRDAYRAAAREDNETANCLPPGMPGIMGQPYPM